MIDGKTSAFGAVACSALLFLATQASADTARRPVSLGEVSASVACPTLRDAAGLLRHDVQSELDGIDWSRAKGHGKHLTLSASLVRMESVRTAQHGVSASCTVSATLRDESGALVATLEGRANAEDDAKAAQRAERDALKVAVRGAVARVPEALDRVR